MKLFSEDNRISTILKRIETQSSCDMDKLADQMRVSKKTVQNDVKELNCLLGGYACISQQKGICKLIVFDPKGFSEIRNKIYAYEDLFNSSETRMAYIFWQLMDAKEPYLIDELAEETKVGRSTTVSDINKLRKILEKYNIEIQGKANIGVQLIGDEMLIRYFILENVYEQLFINYPLGQTVRETLYDFQKDLSLDALGFGFFFRFFVIMTHRIETGHCIKALDEKYQDLYNNQAYKIVDGFLNKIETIKGYKIPKEERIFLCIAVAGMRTPINTGEIEQRLSVSEDVADLIIEMIDRIYAELNVAVITNELFDDFVYHVFFMINRLKYGFHIHNPSIDNFKDKYSVAYKMAEIGREVIEKHEGIEVTEDEMAFLAAYFGVFLAEQENKDAHSKIAIVSKSGKVMARLIENQVKKVFDDEPEFTFFYDGDFKEELKDSFDYIFTTANLDIDTDTPIIYMDEVFNREHIKRKIENIKYLSDAGRTIRKGIDSLFLNLLDEKRYFVLDPKASYDQNVEKMAKNLIMQGELDIDFAVRLKERESYSTMILDENIAFPHANNMYSKLTLALGVYPEKSEDPEYGPVKIIVMLGIPRDMENDTVLIQLYDEILSIAKEPNFIDKICYMKTYKELLLYVAEENNIFK